MIKKIKSLKPKNKENENFLTNNDIQIFQLKKRKK